jgi:hypothetical protein
MKLLFETWRPVTRFGVVLAFCFVAYSDQARSLRAALETTQRGPVDVAWAGSHELFGGLPSFENLEAEACDHLRRHLDGRQIGDQMIQRVVFCEPPVVSAPSQVGTAAAVAVQLDVDGPPSHGAFLFVRFDKGWRLVGQLLEPAWTHGGYCKSKFQLRWKQKSGKLDSVLDTLSERICHMPLDREEIAAGENDIATSECRRARYGLIDNRLRKTSEAEFEGPCRFR